MIEREKTYLALSLPDDVYDNDYQDMIDIYIGDPDHPQLRIRKKGEKYSITKKQPVDNDPSVQRETTIPLTQDEYNELATLAGRRIYKHRYNYDYQWKILEIDVFQKDLSGLIVVDAEFDNDADMNAFTMPEFCERDVTHDMRVAGGVLAGKSFGEIEQYITNQNTNK